jgi:hypothetical protein
MKFFKHGISLVAVSIALLVASFGGGFYFAPASPEPPVEPTHYAPEEGEVEGARGLHW